ncbi:hypothetical protein [Desulfovibrio gilichinskyi]|uniref:Tetratricopeptide repeat-containing protein n=1 Tax=Desulfovibrio gilichinskyi TaxID=1519643 RepID=A0A1X7CAN2_9BACT|nr:hypothetical protein [Desulfovibrio gilichinskyi]SME92634.1 hypothetical protein SAMN06295933_0555 [Desulfovibrio gilichinskyi]
MKKIGVLILLIVGLSLSGCALKTQEQRNREVIKTMQLLQSASENHSARNFEGMLVDANEGLKIDPKRVMFLLNKAVANFHLGNTVGARKDINQAIKLMESGQWSEGETKVRTQEDARIEAGARVILYSWRGLIDSNIIPYNLLTKSQKKAFPIKVSDEYMFAGIDESPNLESPGLVACYIYANTDKGDPLSFIIITQSELDQRYFYTKEDVNNSQKKVVDFDVDLSLRNRWGAILPVFPKGKYDHNMRIKMISAQKSLCISFFSPVGSKMAKMSFDELLHGNITKYPKEFETP